MNDLVDDFRMEGDICIFGKNIYDKDVSPMLVRKRVGMVAQKPIPFISSIYNNIAWAPKLNGYKGNMDELVEKSLRQAALWDEVKDRLNESGMSLSGGQQQRLCIARTIAMDPDVILMDEPCAALDPISTNKVEELIASLKKDYCLLIVTHNMQQAARVSDYTAFMYQGDLVEFGLTEDVFKNPKDDLTRDYVSGSFG
jgi:phosphate transport system ATP-binding protein